MLKKYLFAFVAAMILNMTAYAAPECGDLLSMMEQKPEALEFVSCLKTRDEDGLPILNALYRVSGQKADEVEACFVKEANMPVLTYQAGAWKIGDENRPYGEIKHHLWAGKDQFADEFIIIMQTEPAKHIPQSDKTQWRSIDWFYVQVLHYLEG